MASKKLNMGKVPANSVPEKRVEVNGFEMLKRAFETAYASGEYASELQELGAAVARSVLKRVIDPQAASAPEKDKVSSSGCNPYLTEFRRDMGRGIHQLADVAAFAERAFFTHLDKDGYSVTETADADALAGLDELIGDTLGDGMELYSEAITLLLEVAEKYSPLGGAWLDAPITVKVLKKRVLIGKDAKREYKERESAPMLEVYRGVRRYIGKSRAVQVDPRNGYLYIEDMASGEDGENALETVYRRMGKYADLGGEDMSGNYTPAPVMAHDYYSLLDMLELTERQRTVIDMRMQGYGYLAIGKALGVSQQAVLNTLVRVQGKCAALGFTPDMWREIANPDFNEN